MLGRIIGIACLSLAGFMASATEMSNDHPQTENSSASQDPKPHIESDLRHIPLSEKQMQLAFFAGLGVILVGMVAVLFRKYKGRGKAIQRKRDSTNSGTRGITFNPSFFSSESTPAVLVAHHDHDIRLFITNTLRLNYRVISTSDGEEAFDKAFETVPDLVITDHVMPRMDGPLLCRKLKSTEVTSHIPVIMLTSEEQEGADHGPTGHPDFIMSPSFDARELLLRVQGLISSRKKRYAEYRNQLRSYPALSTRASTEEVYMRKVLKVLEEHHSDASFDAEGLSRKLNMDRLQLHRKLKALTGYAPGEFMRQFRLERAKRHLLNVGSSVTEVAARSGFNNVASFTRSFKNYTGKSPAEFATLNKSSDESILRED